MMVVMLLLMSVLDYPLFDIEHQRLDDPPAPLRRRCCVPCIVVDLHRHRRRSNQNAGAGQHQSRPPTLPAAALAIGIGSRRRCSQSRSYRRLGCKTICYRCRCRCRCRRLGRRKRPPPLHKPPSLSYTSSTRPGSRRRAAPAQHTSRPYRHDVLITLPAANYKSKIPRTATRQTKEKKKKKKEKELHGNCQGTDCKGQCRPASQAERMLAATMVCRPTFSLAATLLARIGILAWFAPARQRVQTTLS